MQCHNQVETTCNLDRRTFLATIGAAYSTLKAPWLEATAYQIGLAKLRKKEGATVRAAFLYPPSTTFSDDPDG